MGVQVKAVTVTAEIVMRTSIITPDATPRQPPCAGSGSCWLGVSGEARPPQGTLTSTLGWEGAGWRLLRSLCLRLQSRLHLSHRREAPGAWRVPLLESPLYPTSQAPFQGSRWFSCQAWPKGRASGLLLRALWVLEAACHGACVWMDVSLVSRGCFGRGGVPWTGWAHHETQVVL